MSRLVAVSNRISVPRRGAAPGGLAVGLLAAMRARRGMWFGWDGDTVETASADPSVVRKEAWRRISNELDRDKLDAMTTAVPFDNVKETAASILEGKVRGRAVVEIG